VISPNRDFGNIKYASDFKDGGRKEYTAHSFFDIDYMLKNVIHYILKKM
jgi:hypothetical protein